MAIETHISDITHVIQLAVAPVFLLTAVGTIITALTNRLGRAVDRRRVVEDRLPMLADETADVARDELDALGQRIRAIYVATSLAVLCGLFVCLSISLAFVATLLAVDLAWSVAALFVLAMFALIGALVMILREIFIAVTAPRHTTHRQ
jgi:hypothetical protein